MKEKKMLMEMMQRCLYCFDGFEFRPFHFFFDWLYRTNIDLGCKCRVFSWSAHSCLVSITFHLHYRVKHTISMLCDVPSFEDCKGCPRTSDSFNWKASLFQLKEQTRFERKTVKEVHHSIRRFSFISSFLSNGITFLFLLCFYDTARVAMCIRWVWFNWNKTLTA
jgi:hypothetical protein